MAASKIEAIDFRANPYRTILKLATPTIIAMMAQALVSHVDAFFFKHLPSPEDSNGQAALLHSMIIVWLFGGSLSAVSVGTQALAARRFAEGDRQGAGAVLTSAAVFVLGAGAVISVGAYIALPSIFSVVIGKEQPEVLSIAVAYSRWRMLGIISMAMTMAVKAFFDGVGRTGVHLVASTLMNILNVALCWVFIFGHLGAPRMGAEGAGFSAFVSTWAGLAIMIAYVIVLDRRAGDGAKFHAFRWANVSKTLVWSILKLSIPAALATIVMMAGFSRFTKVALVLDGIERSGGKEAVNGAAMADIIFILHLTFTACIAFGTATATIVGQALGSKKPEEGTRFGWASVRLGLVVFGVVGLCEGLLFTSPLVNLFTDSPAVATAMMTPLRMMGIVTPIIAVAMILSEALFGAGTPIFVAVTQFVLVFLCLVPLAHVFAIRLHMGMVGIWTAACIYAALAATAMGIRFHQGKWKHVKL